MTTRTQASLELHGSCGDSFTRSYALLTYVRYVAQPHSPLTLFAATVRFALDGSAPWVSFTKHVMILVRYMLTGHRDGLNHY